eukprot:188487-Pyramimonas_sp.AAC.1
MSENIVVIVRLQRLHHCVHALASSASVHCIGPQAFARAQASARCGLARATAADGSGRAAPRGHRGGWP